MLNGATYDLLRQAFNLLFVTCLPLVALTALAGILFGIVQAATSIQDNASAYALKLMVVVGLAYALFGSFSEGLRMLLQTALAAVGGI